MAMPPTDQCPTDVSLLKQLLLEMAQQQSVDQLLTLVVDRLAQLPDAALVRVWLVGPDDTCAICKSDDETPSHDECLHLVASEGRSLAGERWNRLDGDFHRFQIGARKVGMIALNAQPIEIPDTVADPNWIALPEWAEEEKIRAFGGQPLIHQGRVLGVLAVFTRACLGEDNLTWMRMIADHLAAAISMARAFEEIDKLKQQLEQERDYLRAEVLQAHAFGEIVGRSPALQNVLQQLELVAPTDASVLVLGESGTGKELIAREIHRRSERKSHPMVKVNCASVPRELYESEFFGHEKGAFTGAIDKRTGRFELADGGTLFLDEVGEIPLALQSKLLRVLQEGEFERVGSGKTHRVDVRIVAATNRDLKEEVAAGRFREDLYYRLNVFPIEIAPLRERRDDIELLAAHFVTACCEKMRRPHPRITRSAIQRLTRYGWPGNIRELQNVIERAVITSTGGKLVVDLPDADDSIEAMPSSIVVEETAVISDADMRRRERDNLLAALKEASWKISGPDGAAAMLGIKPTTLTSRMKKMGIKRPV